jgi:alpha-mannosidase
MQHQKIAEKRPLYYVLSTHWDREWYQTFQDYRYRLVELVDEVLEGISSGELKGPFYSDGQSCLLDDYLEVRPERRGEVEQCVREGMIAAGPWYVLPDEFLVSGEALIRNIRLGFDAVRGFGAEPSRTGFLCDMFGHISQMPQILNKFGINNAFLWRGLNCDRRNIIWEGADGSRVCSLVFGNDGYGDYAIVTRQAAKKQYEDFDPKQFASLLTEYIEQEISLNDIEPILLFDGLDHQCWDRDAYAELFRLLEEDGRFELVHTGLDEFAQAMEADFSKVDNVICGQLRETTKDYKSHEWLITGVVSSRVDIKQDNTYCQNALCHWAEPFSVFDNLLTGKAYPAGFLNIAWKWLIKNHPHDSICGCSIDQVHKDMEFRFSQARQIADRLTTESLKSITLAADADIDEGQIKVCVFNPLPQKMDDVVELELPIPKDWPIFQEFFGFEAKPGFFIKDSQGNRLDYQRVSQKTDGKVLNTFKTCIPTVDDVTKVRVALKVPLESIGYTTLIVEKADEGEPTRHSDPSQLAHSGNCLENEYLRIEVRAGGAVSMLDKRSGTTYDDLLVFEDNVDIGDGWYHGLAVNDEIYSSKASNAQLSITANGPGLAKLKLKNVLELPAEFNFASMTRSEKVKKFEIISILTLKKGADKLEIETFVDNNICDHRLRVCFPTFAKSDTYLADSLFDVIEQPIKLAEDNYKRKELDTDTNPQYSWTAINDGKRGLAVLSTGLYESGVADESARPIKLTLFRSTRKTVMTSGEPGCQLLKPLSFKYGVMPLSGETDRIAVYNEAMKLAHGIKTCTVQKRDINVAKPQKQLPASNGLLRIDGAVMTGLSMRGDKYELRFFNPHQSRQQATISLLAKDAIEFTTAYKADFDFNKTDDLVIHNGKITLPLTPKEIATVMLQTGK